MNFGWLPSGEPLDLTTCAREPIHVPGSIQPHGVLLAVTEPDLRVVQVSANVEAFLGRPADVLLQLSLADVLDAGSVEVLRRACAGSSLSDESPYRVVASAGGSGGTRFDAILHRSGGLLLVELEPTTQQSEARDAANAQRIVRRAVDRLDRTTAILDMCARAAVEIRAITGFDRVMVYRFDADWHGEVIAEAKRDDLGAFLGLHYPASDIPEQARRLYTLNPIRIIPDVDYQPARLLPTDNPLTGDPLDLSGAVLRSVSPIHCEYLRNMGVRGSMSISLLREGKLWGLVACHHYGPKFVPYEVRLASEFLSRALSWQIASKEHSEAAEQKALAQAKLLGLVQHMKSSSDFSGDLAALGPELGSLVNASGVAILHEGECRLWGETPTEEAVRTIVRFVAEQPDVFATDRLGAELPGGTVDDSVASGVLSIALAKATRSFILWFRPEVERTVRWGADPDKTVEMRDGIARLSPRGSFSLWKQIVKGRSLPWHSWEIAIAGDVRGALISSVMRHVAQIRALNSALSASNAELDQFAYVASHDLKAPLRGIANLSQWVEEDLGEALAGEARENMGLLRGRVHRLERLIDGILDYSRAGRVKSAPETVDTGRVLLEVVELLAPPPGFTVTVSEAMPVMEVERVPFQQVFLNLLGNALKHARRERGTVTVGVTEEESAYHFTVSDDGPGIAPEFHERIWGIFQTLEARDKVEGAGIGLSIVRKSVESRGGKAWVESALGRGATFHVLWPKRPGGTQEP